MRDLLVGVGVFLILGQGSSIWSAPLKGEEPVARRGVTKHHAEKNGVIKGSISVRGVRNPQNVLVYLEKVEGEHKPPEKPAEMDQKKLKFVPHILPIVKGTTVRFMNSDPILHNVFWPKSKDGSYKSHNLGTWGKGGVRKYTFKKEGWVVMLCNVHPEMEGHIVILQNPFWALADKAGDYEIKNVPPGKYTLKTWYEKPRRLKSKSASVTVSAGGTTVQDFSLSRR